MSILNNVIVSTEITHPSERNWELGDVITSRWITGKSSLQLFMIGWSKDYGIFLISLCNTNGFSVGDIVNVTDLCDELEQDTDVDDVYELQELISLNYRLAKEANINVKY